jgi:hypothetical protein
MKHLQATMTISDGLFLWSSGAPVNELINQHLPSVMASSSPSTLSLAAPGDGRKRHKIEGRLVPLPKAIHLLGALPSDADVSDTFRTWGLVTKLTLELATRQMVIPSIYNGHATWRVLLAKSSDKNRFDLISDSLPHAGHAVPTKERGGVKIHTAKTTIRTFMDNAVNHIYRTNTYPGPSRGWAREVAHALSGELNSFAPKDARFHSIPALLSEWSSNAEAAPLKVGFTVLLPHTPTGQFRVTVSIHDPANPQDAAPINKAFQAGNKLTLGDHTFAHPAITAMRGLSRSTRIFPPLLATLEGETPIEVWWDANTTWDFIHEGAPALLDAGFVVNIPDAFSAKGHQRVRAQIRVRGGEASLKGTKSLQFQWEVILGNRVLDGETCSKLLSNNDPIVWYNDEWVLIDPADLSKLPKNIAEKQEISTTDALRAILTGELNGTAVVADSALSAVIASIRNPEHLPPPKALRAKLRPYQQRGFTWLAALNKLGLGACLADDMGLGKTVQIITLLLHLERIKKPSLVVCPTSVLGNWQREIQRFAPSLKVHRYHGVDRVASFKGMNVILTTYGVLVRDQDLLAKVKWNIVALDEAQAIKNPDSQRAKAANRITAIQRITLTGTPIENRLDELWSLINFSLPGLFGKRSAFQKNFATPIERFGDNAVAERLKRGLAPFLLRRLKSDPSIISDLPEKIERQCYSNLTDEQVRLYKGVVNNQIKEIKSTKSITRQGHVLAMLTQLKQVCNHPAQLLKEASGPLAERSGKLTYTTHLITAILERRDKVIIFSQYKEMGIRLQRHIEEHFGLEAPFMHGGTPPKKRDSLVDDFQADNYDMPVFIISLKAGGTGLNLTAATHVIHYDRWWNPAVEDQATDRAYRIGQKRNVQVHKLITEGTLEERINQLLEDKRALADTVIGTGEKWISQLNDDELLDLVSLDGDTYGGDE